MLNSSSIPGKEPLLPRSKSWVGDFSSVFRIPSFSSTKVRTSVDFEVDEPLARWWHVFPAVVLQFAGLFLLVPSLPNLKLKFFHGDAKRTAFVQSIAESSRALLTTLVSGELGRLSDTIGRKPFIVLSILCTALPFVSLLLSSNLYPYFVGFALAGALGGQNSPAVSAFIADCCESGERAKRFGFLSGVIGVAFMAGPVLGGFLSTAFGHSFQFRVVVAVEAIAFLVAVRLPESLPQRKRKPCKCESCCAGYVQPFKALTKRKNWVLRCLMLVRLLRSLAAGATGTVMMFVVIQKLNLTDFEMGVWMASNGFSGILGHVFLLRLLLQLGLTETGIMIIAVCASTASSAALMMIVAHPSRWYLLLMCVIGVVDSAGDPAFTSLVTKSTDEDYGMVLGMSTAVDGFTTFISPLLSSALFTISALIPFMVSGVLRILTVLLLICIWFASPEIGKNEEVARPVFSEDQVSPEVAELGLDLHLLLEAIDQKRPVKRVERTEAIDQKRPVKRVERTKKLERREEGEVDLDQNLLLQSISQSREMVEGPASTPRFTPRLEPYPLSPHTGSGLSPNRTSRGSPRVEYIRPQGYRL